MSIVSAFAGEYPALDWQYGGINGGPALQIGSGNAATGVSTITVVTGVTETAGGNLQIPLAVGTPITVGIGANAETVTPTGVTPITLGGFGPGPLSFQITATFSNIHGPQEPVTSGTYGLQEAINAAAAAGGGQAVVSATWYARGGTAAIIQAASFPTNGSVVAKDISNGNVVYWGYGVTSATVVSAPATATSAMVASQVGKVGTWTAITTHVLFTYITADGGETVASSDYSFTATLNLAIGGPGPAAATGAVGYRAYIGANATTTCYLSPVIAANGTVIQCGPIAAFKIGTPFSVATANVAAALAPVQNTAFPSGIQPSASSSTSVGGPFTATGSVTSTVTEMARVPFPTAFLNQVGRTIRFKYYGSWTPAGTAKLILTISLTATYPGTATTLWTVTTAASSGAAIANMEGELVFTVATTGATATIEAHGSVLYCGATATPQVQIAAGDSVQAVSSSIDLTKQNYLVLGISSDATITTSQTRLITTEVLV